MRCCCIVVLAYCLSPSPCLCAETAADYLARGSKSMAHGEYDKAIAAFNQALAAANPKDPDEKQTIRGIYHLRVAALIAKREHDKAIADYTKLLEIDPTDAQNYLGRAIEWDQKKEHDKAIADATKAMAIDPTNDFAYTFRGDQWLAKGAYDKAVADYTKAAAVTPDNPWPYGALANVYATCPDAKYRDGKRAVENAKKAAERVGQGTQLIVGSDLTNGGKDWYSLATLAAAYAESGDFAKAQEYQQEAIEAVYEEKKKEMRSRLELYKQGKPYREPRVKK